MGKKIETISLMKFCRMLDNRIAHKFDCPGAIDGIRGVGKSTLAVQAAKKLKNVRKLNFRRDLVYSKDEVLQHIATRKNSIIIPDEMINVAFKRDFYDESQKKIVKGLDMYRDSHNVFLMCVPNFMDLDIKLQRLCQFRITVLRRGIALLHLPRHSLYTDDPWDIKNNARIEADWIKKGKRPRYSKLTTSVGFIHFRDLSEKERERYDSVKQEKRNSVYNKEIGIAFDDPEKKFYQNLIEEVKAGELTTTMFAKICKVSGRNYRNARLRMNEMLRESGASARLKDYLNSNNSLMRKKGVGFNF